MNTDGNTDAINRHIDELEAYYEQQDAETKLQDLRDEVDKLEAQRDELLEALQLAEAALSGANMNMSVVERKVRAAIAKAKENK